jgi:hypothetical protein
VGSTPYKDEEAVHLERKTARKVKVRRAIVLTVEVMVERPGRPPPRQPWPEEGRLPTDSELLHDVAPAARDGAIKADRWSVHVHGRSYQRRWMLKVRWMTKAWA